jgi:hypothetical protein
MGEVSSAQHMDEEMASGNAHHEHVMLANVSHRAHHAAGAAHDHACHCSACASCCFGAALPTVSGIAARPIMLGFAAPFPTVSLSARFLTGGIERPPRLSRV